MMAMAQFVFRQILKERYLYNLIFIGTFLFALGMIASTLVYGHQHRILTDFGHLALTITLLVMSLSLGSKVFSDWEESRQIFLCLAQPRSRFQIALGIWLGTFSMVALNGLLLFLIWVLLIIWGMGSFHIGLVQSFLLILNESLFVMSLVFLLTLVLRPVLAVMSTIAIMLLSHSISSVVQLKSQGFEVPDFLLTMTCVLPKAEVWSMGTRLYYQEPLTMGEFFMRQAYGFSFSAVFLWGALYIFSKKDLR